MIRQTSKEQKRVTALLALVSLAVCCVSWVMGAICFWGSCVLMLFYAFEENKIVKRIVKDIANSKDKLYEKKSGRIAYELDKHAIYLHVYVRGYTDPLLTLRYDKQTNKLDEKIRHVHVPKDVSSQLQRLFFANQPNEPKKNDSTITSSFTKRLQALERQRLTLLEEKAMMEIETVYLLEETLVNDVQRMKYMYNDSKEENKEEKFCSLLQPLEEKLKTIQSQLLLQNTYAFEQLATLIHNRYQK